jgi:mannose-6-phosphate isomerase-like protein (cupin superfamily)
MLSFLATHPPRTKMAHLNIISLDDGRSSAEFKSPTDEYLVINRLPPAASDEDVSQKKVPNKANCVLAPPLHWHHSQMETFHILEGTAKITLENEQQLARPGEKVVIPVQQFHTFCNASEHEDLVVEFVLEPATRNDDEAYFSKELFTYASPLLWITLTTTISGNIWGYRDDCRKAGIQRSLPQALLFMWRGKIVPALSGPKFIARPLGLFLTFFGGVILGKWILGYSDSYSEYYHSRAE